MCENDNTSGKASSENDGQKENEDSHSKQKIIVDFEYSFKCKNITEDAEKTKLDIISHILYIVILTVILGLFIFALFLLSKCSCNVCKCCSYPKSSISCCYQGK